MKFIPILFSTPMVQEILPERKTMTRREIKKKYSNTDIQWREDKYGKKLVAMQNDVPDPVVKHNEGGTTTTTRHIKFYSEIKCPYGKPGDVLWVKEMHYSYGIWIEDGQTETGTQKWKFVVIDDEILFFNNKPSSIFKSRDKNNPSCPHWYKRNSLFMPKTACRIFLEVVNIKAERLNDICEEDAKAEGVLLHERGVHYLDYVKQKHGLTQFIYGCRTAKESFNTLWEVVNGRESLLNNPWVFAITFKKIDKPSTFLA